MLLSFFISQLAVAVLANKFHKYPYVFLLDVGNEEIEKANTEQLRLSVPGGSLAIKYPAIGEGDLIGHVRVSGIDFGTDLKANIVQGGPGYKYVVLVFMGNPGVEYDAVVTIQTVPNTDDSEEQVNMDGKNAEVEDDLNNSAEETDTENQNVYSVKENIQSMQSSSNIYQYSNEEFDSQNSINDENDDDDGDKASNSIDENYVLKEQNNEIVSSQNDDSSQNVALKDDSVYPSGNDHVYSLNDNKYGKYEAFRPLIIGGVRFYPQAALYTQDYSNEKSIYDQENHASDDGSESKYKDSNNNDSVNGSPVEY